MNFTLNVWSFLLLLGASQALILTGIIILKIRRDEQGGGIFALLLLSFCIILVDHSTRLSSLYKTLPQLLYLSDALWFALMPLLWLYVKRSLSKKLRWHDALHFVPYLFFLFWYWGIFTAPADIKLNIYENYLKGGSQYHLLVKLSILGMMLQMLTYLVFSIVYITRYEREFKKQFSGNDIDKVGWLKRIISFFTLYFLFEFTFSTYRNFMGIQNKVLENWSLVAWTVFIISLAYTILNRPNLIGYRLHNLGNKKSKPDIVEPIDALTQYMSEKKPYLDNGLSLHQLADGIGLGTHQLSSLLNNELETNFYEYINTHRVRAVKSKLEEGEHRQYSIFGIAQATGFNSKASFYKFFKKEYHTTPRGFLLKLEESNK
ncbi:MAG: helix-turn-helix domain-containing protein [Reichenbachiella sp.]|uniref:helix-turn-helix domain-containing protein n=1 Tax=Reichenbachiella sp. TaxID=2184521 RepID=UPI0032997022